MADRIMITALFAISVLAGVAMCVINHTLKKIGEIKIKDIDKTIFK